MECSGGDGCNAQYLVVPVTPQLRVRHDYEYRWFNVELDRSGFLDDVSSALHRDIAMYTHKDMVTSVPLFVGFPRLL